MKAQNFTTTLSPKTIQLLNVMSKQSKKTKRQIIEEALEEWRKRENQRLLGESYKKLGTHEEGMEFTNAILPEDLLW